jgi:transposase
VFAGRTKEDLMSPNPSVIVFDVNETLSDMSPMAARSADVGDLVHVAGGDGHVVREEMRHAVLALQAGEDVDESCSVRVQRRLVRRAFDTAASEHQHVEVSGERDPVDASAAVGADGCQWRYLPELLGRWTRVWSPFRRWSRNGTWARALTVLHIAARDAEGRVEAMPSMVVIDTHLTRDASNGGAA